MLLIYCRTGVEPLSGECRIPLHLIYTMYISRDFDSCTYNFALAQVAHLAHFCLAGRNVFRA